jgi:hypothetical protein
MSAQNSKNQSTLTVDCVGCHKSVTKPYRGLLDMQEEIDQILQEGWIKRRFSSTVWCWFCSHQCAYTSASARQMEEWWQQHSSSNDVWMVRISYLFWGLVIIVALWSAFSK